jgi:CDP-6-deoxy-D-xylo-4-hexulose-3-dehydrase
MKKYIYPLVGNVFNKSDINAAINVLRSGQLTMSKKVRNFEAEFAKYIGVKYAIMVNSGSSANLLATRLLSNPARKKKLKFGDEVLVPGICWSTSLWPLVQCGLKPVFVDINIETLNMDVADLKKKISKKTKMIFCVHVLGNSTNMDEIKKITKKYNLLLIEDACEAIGSTYKSKKLGSFGNVGTYSFFYSKQITSGEGGMIVCNDKNDYQLLLSLRSHGWAREEKNHHKKMIKLYPKLEPRFIFSNYGYNLRPLELQAALANQQLKRLSTFELNRKFNRDQIIKIFQKNNSNISKIKFIESASNVDCKWYGVPMILSENLKNKKREIISKIEKAGIETRPIVCGNILNQPAIKLFNLNHKKNVLKNCQEIEERGFFIGLENKKTTNTKLNLVANTLNKVLDKY